jgi:hypothetical protein
LLVALLIDFAGRQFSRPLVGSDLSLYINTSITVVVIGWSVFRF